MGAWNAQGRVSKRTGFVPTNQGSRRKHLLHQKKAFSADPLFCSSGLLAAARPPPPAHSPHVVFPHSSSSSVVFKCSLQQSAPSSHHNGRGSCSRHENPSDQRSVFSLFFSSSSTDRTPGRMRRVTADWKDLLGGFGRWIGQDLRCEVVFIYLFFAILPPNLRG